MREETVTEDNSKFIPGSFVLMPNRIDKQFLSYPNITSIENVSHLNITCSHREDEKLYVANNNNFISTRFPHLLKCAPFDLVKNNSPLHLTNLIIILCTSLDMSSSLVSHFLQILF